MIISNTNEMRNTRTIWYDFETTGLNPFHEKIIEISARDNNGVTFDSLLKINTSLSPDITKITGITDEMLNTQGKEYNTAIHAFYTYIISDSSNDRVFLIAHNGDAFDKIFLKTQLKKLNLQLPSKVNFLDSIFVTKLLYPKLYSHSMASLGKYFSVVNESAHRAAGDVNALIKLWDIWMLEFNKQYSKNDIITVYNTIYI
jgi:DNA polymerase III alpha subunit (gram-positive type)